MNIIAIDPGLGGGIAYTNPLGPACMKMPLTEGDIVDELRSLACTPGPTVAYMEEVPISMGNKGTGSTKLNMNAGFIRGCLMSMGVRLVMIRPATWQKRLGVGQRNKCSSDSEWKTRLKSKAQQRYPTLPVTLKTADALLILDYAAEQERNNP